MLALQLQELEMENAKLKIDLQALRKKTADGETGGQELLSELFFGFTYKRYKCYGYYTLSQLS
jgi:hypothetical protein